MPATRTKSRSVRTEAIRLAQALPKDSTWDDLMYQVYVRQKIEAGLADIREGKTHTHESIRKEFGRL